LRMKRALVECSRLPRNGGKTSPQLSQSVFDFGTILFLALSRLRILVKNRKQSHLGLA